MLFATNPDKLAARLGIEDPDEVDSLDLQAEARWASQLHPYRIEGVPMLDEEEPF